MANQPRPGNPARAVRVEDELWDAALAIAAERGENLSDVMRAALRRYVSSDGSKRRSSHVRAERLNDRLTGEVEPEQSRRGSGRS